MTPHYSMVIQWSDEDQTFVVSLPEFSALSPARHMVTLMPKLYKR